MIAILGYEEGVRHLENANAFSWVVAAAIIETLNSLRFKYPEVRPDKLKELAAARAALVGDKIISLTLAGLGAHASSEPFLQML